MVLKEFTNYQKRINMTELLILKFLLIIYWLMSTSYFYERGEELGKKYNLTRVIDKILLFLLSIIIGWCLFPIQLSRFLAIVILKAEDKHKEIK